MKASKLLVPLLLLLLSSAVCAAQQTIVLGGQRLTVKRLYRQDFNGLANHPPPIARHPTQRPTAYATLEG